MPNITAEEFFGEGAVEIPQPQDDLILSGKVSADSFFGGGAVETKKPEDENEALTFAQHFGEDLRNRVSIMKEIEAATKSGEQTMAEGLWQATSKVGAGLMMDFMGEVVSSAGRGLAAITPEEIKDPIVKTATAAGVAFLNTDIGKAGLEAAQSGMETYNKWSGENPRAARNIEGLVNMAILVSPVKAKGKVSGKTVLGEVGEFIGESGIRQANETKTNFLQRLVIPKETAAVRREKVKRTGETGLLKKRVTEASKEEIEMARYLEDVPVKSNESFQINYNIIDDAVGKEANSLMKVLEKEGVEFDRKEFTDLLNKSMSEIDDLSLVSGNVKNMAAKAVSDMVEIFNKNEATPAGLLKSRKDFDSYVRNLRVKSVFDTDVESAAKIAVEAVRNTANDFVSLKVPDVKVKASLKKQHNLLKARDNIGDKAAEEASNLILRHWQKVQKLVRLKGEASQTLALAFGVGGLGAAAMFAPFISKIAFTGIGIYQGGKALFSPKSKKAVSLLLKESDKAIRKAKDANLIRGLKADKAALIELLKQMEEEE